MYSGLILFLKILAEITFPNGGTLRSDSIFKGRRVTVKNPWGAATLEWTTPIIAGHGNWPGEIPEVHRWAYDYGKDGRDHIPQNVPVGKDESAH